MIDYIKATTIYPNAERLLNSPYFDFNGEYNHKTGEVSEDKLTTHYKGLKLILYNQKGMYKNNRFILSGSLHKFKNNNLHNADDFSHSELVEVLNEIEDLTFIKSQEMFINTFEYGLNIPLSKTDDFINNLFMHKTKPFSHTINDTLKGNNKICNHSQYDFKLYNKSKESRLYAPDNTMRVELRAKGQKARIFNNTLENLKTTDFAFYGQSLKSETDNLLYYEDVPGLTKQICANYSNPLYWYKLLNRKSTSAFYKHKYRLNEAINNKPDNMKNQLKNMIEYKVKLLMLQS